MTPFQAIYGFAPPQVAEMFLIEDNVEDAKTMLQRRRQTNQVIRENLLQAQERMKISADRTEVRENWQSGIWCT